MPAPPAADAPPSRAKLTGRATILLLVVAVLAVSYASSMRAWLNQRSEMNALKAEIVQRKAEVASLEQAQRRWHDPAYIETQARLRFGWVMPGETGYRVIGDNGQILSDGANELADPHQVLPTDDRQWWETSWGSVVEAGKTPSQVAAESRPAHRPIDQIGGKKHHRHQRGNHGVGGGHGGHGGPGALSPGEAGPNR